MHTSFSADALLAQVTRQEGLHDFGSEHYVANYQRAVADITREIRLTPQGYEILEGIIRNALTNVLRMQRDLKAHPEILDEVLAPPIVISGFARTGSTKLQRIVSTSPATQALKWWKVMNPAPFPGTDPAKPDPRIAVAEEVARLVQEQHPEFWAAHPQPAHDAEEDFYLQDMTFAAPVLGMRFAAWRFTNAVTPIDSEVFAFLRTMLKYLQWQDGSADRGSRPWVLKGPILLGNIGTIQKIFPGAKFIFCHRDITTLMASLCSHTRISAVMATEDLDDKALGREVLAYWSREWSRSLEERALLPAGSCCDIRFDEIDADGVAASERVHAFAGLAFDAAARKAAQDWEAANPRHKGGRHVYSLSDYGLTQAQVRAAFQSYYDYFHGTHILG